MKHLKISLVTSAILKIRILKSRLQDLREIKLHGHMIRSHVKDLTYNKKPTKYFCGLEKRNYVDKTICKFKLQNGTFLTTQKEILHEVKTFYEKLFSNEDTGNLNEEITLDSLIDNKKFTCLKKARLQNWMGK